MALYDTVANVVSDTAVELGLGAVTDVFAATDENIVQLRYLLKSLGRELFLKNGWLQGQKEHVFVTNGSPIYALPEDFDRMIDQTGWSRTDMRPVYPASPQEWQYLQATMVGTVFTVIFRPFDLTLKVWPLNSTGVTIAFEYQSRFWVREAASTSPDKDAPTLNSDVIHLDSLLVVKSLKLSFLRSKGFDTQAAQADFDAVLDGVRSARSNMAPVLSLYGGRMDEEKFLDAANVPSSGFGGGSGSGSFTAMTKNFTVPASLPVGAPVYIKPDGTADRANATSLATAPCVGFVFAKLSATEATIQVDGFFTGFTGLLPGSTYFLDTSGTISTSPPTAPGNIIQKVGVAASATELLLEPVLDFTVI